MIRKNIEILIEEIFSMQLTVPIEVSYPYHLQSILTQGGEVIPWWSPEFYR